MAIFHCDSEESARDKALSKREEVELFREHCSLIGWQRVVVIGTKRDELRNANVGCSPQHVSVALSSIVWSAGNVPTPPIVEKCIAIWDRMGQEEAVKAIFLSASPLWQRLSFRRVFQGHVDDECMQNQC